jgi:hypothetical protein
MDSNFRHFERAGRRDQIRISHFERDLGEFGDLFAHDSNGPAVRTNFLWDGLQQGASGQRLDCCVLAWSGSHSGMPMLSCCLCPHLPPPKAASAAFGLCPNLPPPKQLPGHNRRAAYSRGRATSTDAIPACMRKAVRASLVVGARPPGPPPWPADRLAVRADPPTAEPQPQLHLGARA